MIELNVLANELIRIAQNENDVFGGDLMTNFRLQKLLYYEQGFHLAAFSVPLFKENIEAWEHGPAIPEIDGKFNGKDRHGILSDPELEIPVFENDCEKDLFYSVAKLFGQYSSAGLKNMTREESPWTETRIGQVINHKS